MKIFTIFSTLFMFALLGLCAADVLTAPLTKNPQLNNYAHIDISKYLAQATRSGHKNSTRGPLQAGVSVIDITPPIGVPMGGYGSRMDTESAQDPLLDPYDYAKLFMPTQGVRDRLRAKAVVLDNGSTRIALVSIDLIGVFDNTFLDTLALIQGMNLGIDQEHLFLAASHSHSSMGLISNNAVAPLAMDLFDQRIADFLAQKLATVIQAAVNDLKPAGIGITRTTAYLHRNRRGDPPKIDPEVGVIRIDQTGGKKIAIFHYTAHGTSVDEMIPLFSAECMGAAERYLEQHLGPDCIALYLNGAEGDIAPIGGGYKDYERIDWWGAQLGAIVEPAFNTLYLQTHVTLDAVYETLPLPPAYMRPHFEVPEIPLDVTIPMGPLAPSQTRVQAFRINDLVMGTFPGEAIVELGLRFKSESLKHTAFNYAYPLGLCNDHLAYLTTPEEYWQGGYEAFMSFYGPDGGELILHALVDLVAELAIR